MVTQSREINVLLVEDDEVDVMNVKRALRRNDFRGELHLARDGAEALATLRADGMRLARLLILLDLNMPMMNGLEFLQELRADRELAWLPVVVLTTSDEERDKIEAFDLNVAGYMIKPVTFDKFVQVVGAMRDYWTLVEMPDARPRA